MSKKLSKSRSLSQWEISAPFRKLSNVELSGELLHKGKLTWNRRVVAIANGCLAMYKPDKDGRPLLVIPLMGYEAAVNERKEGRRGFEIKMTHPQDDTHLFSVDVREWAYTWKEHINNQSQGNRTPTGHPIHLARTLSNDLTNVTSASTLPSQNSHSNNAATHGSKLAENLRHSWMDDDDYDEINVRSDDNVFFEEDEEEHYEGEDIEEDSSVLSQSLSTPATRSPILSRYPFKIRRSEAFRASVKSTPEQRTLHKNNTISSILRRRKREFQARFRASLLIPPVQTLQRPQSTMSLARLDLKALLYNWSTPLDRVIMTLRRVSVSSSAACQVECLMHGEC